MEEDADVDDDVAEVLEGTGEHVEYQVLFESIHY